jgi:tungstate transport system ATP-binding protein
MSKTNTIQSGTLSTSESIIDAENLLVIRNQRRLLEDVSASIENGKITLLLGHNGAGKTLFLWALHGLIEVDYGHIDGPPRQQQRMVFQKPIILRRSARNHFKFLCPGLHSDAIADWFEKAQLSHQIDSPARQLSGGEAQKLSLIGALACKPKLLFLDEPTAHLDFEATRFFETEIKAANDSGTSIIMTSHNRAQAARLADNILFMDKGKIVEAATAKRFFTTPTSPEARQYLEHN